MRKAACTTAKMIIQVKNRRQTIEEKLNIGNIYCLNERNDGLA